MAQMTAAGKIRESRKEKMPKRVGRISFAKVITVLAIAFGIGVGLCGLDYWLASHGIGKSTEEFGVGPLDNVSLIVMLLSAIGLVITTILWIVAIIVGSFRSKPDAPQRLLDDSDDDQKQS
jgi:hypothetical protein